MKKLLNIVLVATLTMNLTFAQDGGQSLSSLITEHEYATSVSQVSASDRKKANDHFEAKVKSYLEDKSDAKILSDVGELLSSLPDSPEKRSLQKTLKENSDSPALALQEIVKSKSFEKVNAGDSANWDILSDNVNFTIALGGVLVIAAILVFNRGASKSKQERLQADSYSQPANGKFSFHGSGTSTSQRDRKSNPTNNTTDVLEDCSSSPTAANQAKDDAEDEARKNCRTNPIMTREFCDSGVMSSSASNSGDYCSATATLFLSL